VNELAIDQDAGSRHIGRSIVAILVGFAVGLVLTLATDFVLHKSGFFPPVGQWTLDGPLVVATVYRSVYSVISCYLMARLAPGRPMQHALLGGLIGLVLSTVGAVATWNLNLGPHWYPVALCVLSLPLAWIGGKLRLMQSAGQKVS
jgi:hypothetical protein